VNTYGRFLVRLLFVFSLLLGSITTAGAAPAGDAPPDVGARAHRFATDLKKQGFEVRTGDFLLYRIADCEISFPVMGTCYFNNPAAPYILPVVPYWPEEYVDPATAGAFGETRDGFGVSHRFDRREAILIFGVLPPPARYFGIQSYLFTRKGDYETDNDTYHFINSIGATSVFFHDVPGNPKRIQSFDSLSDSNNNVVIERQSGAVFGQMRYFIISPDQNMDKTVRQMLHQFAVDDQDIFSEAIPSNMRFGLNKNADEFLTLIRYSMPEDGGGEGSASAAWRENPSLVVMRIRATRHHGPPQPYPAWLDDSPETRTAVDEHWLQPDLSSLVSAVRTHWGQPCNAADGCLAPATPFIDTQSYPFTLVGPKCDNIGMDCLGDTHDATYQFRGGLSFDNGEVYAVTGTMGTMTGNAGYVSLGVNNFRLRLGVANVNDVALAGSTDAYPGVMNRDKLYVYYFTRDCTGLEALTDPMGQSDTAYCLSVTPGMVPAGQRATLVERDYLKPGTQRGPESTLTLPSQVIRLHRPGP
jgi:hypothetical protein